MKEYYFADKKYHEIFKSIRNGKYLLLYDFLDEGYNVNTCSMTRETLLLTAIKSNNVDATILLLSRGADPNYRNGYGVPPLNFITENSSLIIVHQMIMHGADPTLENNSGDSIYEMLKASSNFPNKKILDMILNWIDYKFTNRVEIDKYSIL